MTDPIADFLTRLRNAIQAKHRVVEVPASNLKKEITKILFEKGYILNYNSNTVQILFLVSVLVIMWVTSSFFTVTMSGMTFGIWD